MSACEKCWADAFMASRIGPESQVEAYRRLLKENEGKPGHEQGRQTGDCSVDCLDGCAYPRRVLGMHRCLRAS